MGNPDDSFPLISRWVIRWRNPIVHRMTSNCKDSIFINRDFFILNWLVVLNMNFMTFHSVRNFILPTDELIFFRGVAQPPTSYIIWAIGFCNHDQHLVNPILRPLIKPIIIKSSTGRWILSAPLKKQPDWWSKKYVDNSFLNHPKPWFMRGV